MRITKSSKDNKKYELLAIKANIGCEKCPECGNLNTTRIPTQKSWYSPLKGHMKVTCYKCEVCGCEYESEPFKY